MLKNVNNVAEIRSDWQTVVMHVCCQEQLYCGCRTNGGNYTEIA